MAAQQSAYIVKHFDRYNGLKSDRAQAITLDRNGFLWIANGDFLMNYDGHRFYDLTKSCKQTGRPIGSIGYFNQTTLGDLVFDDPVYHYRSSGSFEVRAVGQPWSPYKYYMNIAFSDYTNHIDYVMSTIDVYSRGYWKEKNKAGVVFTDRYFLYTDPKSKRETILGRYNQLLRGFMLHRDTVLVFTHLGTYVSNGDKCLELRKGLICPKYRVRYEDVRRVFHRRGRYFLYTTSGLYLVHFSKNNLDLTLLINANDLPKASVVALECTENLNNIFLSTFSEGLYVYHAKHFKADLHPDSIHPSMNSMVVFNDTLYSNNDFKWDPSFRFRGRGSVFQLDYYNLDYIELPNGDFLTEDHHKHGSIIYSSTRKFKKWLKYWCRFPVSVTNNKNELLILTGDSVFMYRNQQLEHYPLQLPFEHTYYRSVYAAQWFHDTLWVGTITGLFGYSNHSLLPKSHDLKNIPIRSIQQDTLSDCLYLFTYGSGVYRYKEGLFTKMPGVNDDLNFIHYALADHLGRWWFPTNNGLYVADGRIWRESFNTGIPTYFYKFGQLDGLRSVEFNSGTAHAHIKLKTGE